jgi:hypothetical protein
MCRAHRKPCLQDTTPRDLPEGVRTRLPTRQDVDNRSDAGVGVGTRNARYRGGEQPSVSLPRYRRRVSRPTIGSQVTRVIEFNGQHR